MMLQIVEYLISARLCPCRHVTLRKGEGQWSELIGALLVLPNNQRQHFKLYGVCLRQAKGWEEIKKLIQDNDLLTGVHADDR